MDFGGRREHFSRRCHGVFPAEVLSSGDAEKEIPGALRFRNESLERSRKASSETLDLEISLQEPLEVAGAGISLAEDLDESHGRWLLSEAASRIAHEKSMMPHLGQSPAP